MCISWTQQREVTGLSRGDMIIRRLPDDETAIRRYIESLWLPYNHELEGTVGSFSLADVVDIVEEKFTHRFSLHKSENYEAWVAIDGPHEEGDLATISGDFVGFITTNIDESPTVFDRPDRLVICDIYIKEPYRGTDLSRELVDRAKMRARETGCPELTLEVGVDNERARTFYEKLGFKPSRHTMVASVTEN